MPNPTRLAAPLLAAAMTLATNLWALPRRRRGAGRPGRGRRRANPRHADAARQTHAHVYEDKDSAEQNKALEDELARPGKGDKYKATVALPVVADVSSYDFWPVKGFVKKAIREESKKAGTTIYCDWSGSFRRTMRLTKNASNVVLVGKDGRVLFAGDGPLNPNERLRLIELLRAEVEGKP